ncbi:hypothetical protein [Ktedonobacter racemifer]|uniref:Uncharacterized protein n=1 Tax=Ktedonobacter racemifer DSM 44963 TaxID=485913 RepID=D6TJ16_KTERA|nr:hypothetical protein [Ktedonobacter racemifer]EFH89423.1 hypothetical protein Krac_10978 [Ktedonobacter racemifer DSM 44963]
MKQKRTGNISHLSGETPQQSASRQRVGTSYGIHPEDTPRLTGETKPAGIDTILICADPTFHHGVQSGRCEFIALSFEKREIVAQDVEKMLQWAMYDTWHSALWRYGYVWLERGVVSVRHAQARRASQHHQTRTQRKGGTLMPPSRYRPTLDTEHTPTRIKRVTRVPTETRDTQDQFDEDTLDEARTHTSSQSSLLLMAG